MAKKAGDLIREARTNAGLSQTALVAQIEGVSASDIGKAERGEKELSQAVLKPIAKATGVTQKSLLDTAKSASTAAKKPAQSGSSAAKKPASTAKKPASAAAEVESLLPHQEKAAIPFGTAAFSYLSALQTKKPR